jgi:hypothetical protein
VVDDVSTKEELAAGVNLSTVSNGEEGPNGVLGGRRFPQSGMRARTPDG